MDTKLNIKERILKEDICYFNFPCSLEVFVQTVEDKINKVKKFEYKNITINFDMEYGYYDDRNTIIDIIGEREETDIEFQRRIERQQKLQEQSLKRKMASEKRKQKKKEEEYQTFLKLKQKYET